MKHVLTACALLLLFMQGRSQTKVFKEVSEGISSSMKAITQDGTLIGYLVFTELERANEDSFHYKITIMDENLNDIGVVNFTELKLDLRSVAFEQEVLCLSYMKSNLLGHATKGRREIKAAVSKGYIAILTQFINLSGKIIRSNTFKVSVDVADEYRKGQMTIGNGGLKAPLRVDNISGKGFACFYGDDRGKTLLVYDTTGKQTWQKRIVEGDGDYHMLVSGHDVYFLIKKEDRIKQGGYCVLGYNLDDSTNIPKYYLKDKKGNQLNVLSFENDPATGKPFLSGQIINNRKGHKYPTPRLIARGAYLGMYSINLGSHEKNSIKPVFNYWNTGESPLANSKGRLKANKSFLMAGPAFRDYQGNTYFTGSALKRSMNTGMVIAEVATIPTIIVPPYLLGYFGTRKFAMRDALLLKQTPKGELSLETSIPVAHGRGVPAPYSSLMRDNKSYYTVTAPETKSTYLVITEAKNITFYSVDQKKIVRSIPRKDGNVSTLIFPAKEGHVLVSEYNSKEKTTKYSIESI
ncbi:DUF6770 family protein [Chitinophaga vietnamensis]|uniref:DUF6770 family protein n=1 Tax=Chitinophaga vietnamensis TaxID=2593957 RepID=UPI0011784E85|nr:DUF6770 family protein [Chitinophaga vietnamensis]